MCTSFRSPGARGYSLLELMIVLVVLTIGILAIAKLFPSASREQVKDRLRTSGSYYAMEKVETLRTLLAVDPDLTDGYHPTGTAYETVGASGAWQRYWTVSHLVAPLDNVMRVDVTVRWTTAAGADSVVNTTYIDH